MNFIESIIKARFRSHMGSKIVGDCGSAIKYPYLWLVPTRSCVIISPNNHIFPPSALGSVLSNLAACSELLITITLPPPPPFPSDYDWGITAFFKRGGWKKSAISSWCVGSYTLSAWRLILRRWPSCRHTKCYRQDTIESLAFVGEGEGGRVGDNNS